MSRCLHVVLRAERVRGRVGHRLRVREGLVAAFIGVVLRTEARETLPVRVHLVRARGRGSSQLEP